SFESNAPSWANPRRLAAISEKASSRNFADASALRGFTSTSVMRWPAYANAIAMPRPMRPAPTAAKFFTSPAFVQALLQLRGREAREAELLERPLSLAQVAPEESSS